MSHFVPILIIAITAGRDHFESLPLLRGLSGSAIAAWTLLPQAALALALELLMRTCGRRVDRSGRWMWIRIAEWGLTLSRAGAIVCHLVAVFVIGWLDCVRSFTGDVILIDEALAAMPPLMVITAGWMSYYRIDRRLREASILGRLDTTGHVPALPSMMDYAWEQTRHYVLIILVPVMLMVAWSESVDRLLAGSPIFAEPEAGPLFRSAVHLAGLAGVLLIAPFLLRFIWTTVPLGEGELRDRLLTLCREQGVRCRDLLVWRTHTGMVNGAVIGFLPQVRYILLTDALLEQLPARQVEAVMAHEVAHARRHHLPWLFASVLVIVLCTWMLVAWGLDYLILGGASLEGTSEMSFDTGLLAALGVGVLSLGWISRRFEEQADAFAAQHLSGVHCARGMPVRSDLVIQPEAAASIARALDAVASLNHMPPHRFTFRHGSIASRIERLRRLIGLPAHHLPIDRLVRRIKIVVAIGIVALIGLAALGV